ncbi:gametocyte-specific factor 1-like isoform X2 [Carassius auratus]|uniref:Gametocyte-specific factor 1-like isoform X2 n=1 Tax=Carassius auratus TaxID=7957 RepID=A0A6P6M6Z5_CARAU|nr:gametocyte-specific factor 1-like isoform X2 [Carassius auratus]
MATIRFGSSVGPSGVNSENQQHGWTEENVYSEDTDDVGDPNRIVQCPYDKNHQIRASRFPFHVLKCRKNHPKLASELKTCPFNARHLFPKHELSHHIANCEDKRSLNAEDGNVELLEKFQVPVNTCTNPSPYEDWETGQSHLPPSVYPMDSGHHGLFHGNSDVTTGWTLPTNLT